MLTIPGEEAFESRGLDIETAARMGARFEPGRFVFDYLSNGSLQFRKIRTVEKSFWIEPKGSRLQLWNIDAVRGLPCRPKEPLVICEGEFDAIAVEQSCSGYVLSVPNGGSSRRSEGEIVIAEDSGFAYLWQDEKLIPEIDQFDKIILATDEDNTGSILRDELALRIGETRCWYVTYPKGCKDANDVLKAGGEVGVRNLIAGAKPMRPGFLVKPSDVPPKSVEASYSTGWGCLDKHIRIVRPELMIVTGEPGHGKGQWIRAMTFHLAEAHGWRTAFLTPEDPAHRLKRDMKRFAERNGATYGEAKKWVDDHFRISTPPEDEPITLETVEREMESAALHHDCQVFVLDPWNEIEHAINRSETETQYIERAIRQLKRKMRRLNMVLIIAVHPTKLAAGAKATLYTINGSANWRNKADHGLIVFRPFPESLDAEITSEKTKDHETMGTPGSVWLTFSRDHCDYYPVPAPVSQGDGSDKRSFNRN